MSISRLEPARQFTNRMIILNRFHAPDQEDYEDSHSALGQIHRGFPSGPVAEQAAYVLAGVIKARPFQEANFRTGWDYVADMLGHRGYDLGATLAEAQELGNNAWDMSEDQPEDLEAYLAEWFGPRIHQLSGSRAAILN